MFDSPFLGSKEEKSVSFKESRFVFVSDFFANQYAGGAELTTQALIDESPENNVFQINSKDVTMDLLSQGVDKFWIFTNFSGLDFKLIPAIIANLKYFVVEYDFKFCKYRSPEKHLAVLGSECDCHNDMYGKMISAFYHGASKIFWMSEAQQDEYIARFPFLDKNSNEVLSSTFPKSFFEKVASLNKANPPESKNDKYIIVGSKSWIKGVEHASEYCEKNNIEYEIVSGVTHDEMLEKMAQSKGYIFLPLGGDTCPRTVIEAKLLGCDLILNENVMHAGESWFNTDDPRVTLDWLMTGTSRFWKSVNQIASRQPTLSGYTTTYNCLDQKYPFEASVRSMLSFCDQVVVVDGGSTDGTVEKLEEIAKEDERLVIHVQSRDWNSERFAVFDGLQKALARALCTSEFCWQQDSDEIVHERDYSKIKDLVRKMPKNMNLVALPVLEFWGSKGKVRLDVNPWKWRVSRNLPHITHGIPLALRNFDEQGQLYSSPGSDGCDYIRSDSFEPVPFVNFYSQDAHEIKEKGLTGDKESLEKYTSWLQQIFSSLPVVYHYSWFNIERKILTYKNYWSKHWQSLYNISQEDTVENNMFFDKVWSEVTEEDIKNLSSRLESETGGWIFHSKIDFSKPTPCLNLSGDFHPSLIKSWAESNGA